MRKLTLGAIALAASTMIGSGVSHADYIGHVWTGLPTNSGAATNATIAQRAALEAGGHNFDATFTVSGNLNFPGVADSTTATVSQFLASGGVNNCVGGGCADIMNGSYFFIENTNGTLTRAPGGNATITHDDGIEVANNGNIVFSAPGPTPPVPANFVWGNDGALTLAYGECCSGPATLQTNFQQVVPVPEPASLAILGAALAGFGVMRRRRKTV